MWLCRQLCCVLNFDAKCDVIMNHVLIQINWTRSSTLTTAVRCLQRCHIFSLFVFPSVIDRYDDPSALNVDIHLLVRWGVAVISLGDFLQKCFEMRFKCWRDNQSEIMQIDFCLLDSLDSSFVKPALSFRPWHWELIIFRFKAWNLVMLAYKAVLRHKFLQFIECSELSALVAQYCSMLVFGASNKLCACKDVVDPSLLCLKVDSFIAIHTTNEHARVTLLDEYHLNCFACCWVKNVKHCKSRGCFLYQVIVDTFLDHSFDYEPRRCLCEGGMEVDKVFICHRLGPWRGLMEQFWFWNVGSAVETRVAFRDIC